jgi:hypothetical protein
MSARNALSLMPANEDGSIDEAKLRSGIGIDMRGAAPDKVFNTALIPYMAAAGVSAFVLFKLFSESYSESKVKMSNTLTELDSFCKFRLDRTAIKAPPLAVGEQHRA